jgi:hypothetical protein
MEESLRIMNSNDKDRQTDPISPEEPTRPNATREPTAPESKTPASRTPEAPDLGARDTDPLAGVPETDTSQALEQLLPTLQALVLPEGFMLRAEVRKVVSRTLQVAEAFAEDRAQIERTFRGGKFDVDGLSDLAQRALALWQADMDASEARDLRGELQELLRRARPVRRRLLDAAIYLWSDHEELGERVAEIRKGHGHLDTADDLAQLADLFVKHWDDSRRSRVEPEDLEQAKDLARRLAAALKRTSSKRRRSLQELRSRAAFYAYQGVQEARHAARFVFRDQPERMEDYPAFYARDNQRARPQVAEPIQPEAPAAEGDQSDSRVA